MIAILLGAPGAGKGTQSQALCARYGLTHLATGDIFRSEIAAKSALGLKASDYVKAGKLVPDDLVTEMVAGRMDVGQGHYLLDGFPRTLEQAQSLSATLAANKSGIDVVVFLNLSRQEAMKRLTSRRVCPCGQVYNLISQPPQVDGVCDKCGKKIEQRVDDSEATAAKRLMVFEDLTQPLVAYYKAEQVFEEVDAARSPADVTVSLAKIMEAALARSGAPAAKS